MAPISFYLHKLFVPLHAKIGGVISHDLGYSTQKKKADFASAGPVDIEYQNSGCVLCLDREIQNPLVNLLRLTSVQDFQKWQNIIYRPPQPGIQNLMNEIQHIVGKVITQKIYRGMQINVFVDHPKYLAISTYESSEPIPGS